MIAASELVSLQRSAAMLGQGQTLPVDGQLFYALCSEVLEQRKLLQRRRRLEVETGRGTDG